MGTTMARWQPLQRKKGVCKRQKRMIRENSFHLWALGNTEVKERETHLLLLQGKQRRWEFHSKLTLRING